MENSTIAGFQLSPQQQRLWRLQQADCHLPYRVQCAIVIEGNLNPIILEAALQNVVDRHEILHTIFCTLPGMNIPLQVIHSKPAIDRYDLIDIESGTQQAELEALFNAANQQPFDIEQGPVLKTSLVMLAPDKHILLVGLPALCADTTTLENLLGEISHSYAACLQGTQFDEPLQYADLAAWQNELFAGEDALIGTEYWRQQDISPWITMRLPFELRSPVKLEFQPRLITSVIQADWVAKLEAITQTNKTSLSVLLLTCWQVLLWRLTRKSDIVTGIACNGRNYEELKSALGLFTKFLPIHTHLQDSMQLTELLQQVGESVQAVEKWQEFFKWEDIAITKDNNLSGFYLSFEFTELPKKYTAANLSFAIHKQYACIDRFKVKLLCARQNDALITEFHYDASLFLVEAIQHLSEQFQTLLQNVVIAPETTIGEVEILSKGERQRLLTDFNNTTVDYPQNQCIHQLFAVQVERTPHNIAVVFEDQKLTYQELNQRANQLAHYLQKQGIQPETPVALYCDRSLEMIVGLLGILKAGGAYVPLDPALPIAGLAFRLQDTQAPILLTQQFLLAGLPKHTAQVVCLDTDWETIAQQPDATLPSQVTPENLVYIIYTSGSTGKPKGVAVEHRQLCNYLHSIRERLNLTADASFALISTLAADLGNTMIFPALCTGGCLHVLSQRANDPAALAEYCSRHRIDCLKIVPSHLKALLSSTDAQRLLPRQRLILGGEAADWTLIEQIQQHSPECQIFNHYGPTETTVGVLTHLVQKATDCSEVPLGKPLANTQIYLLNNYLQLAPIGVPGEIYIAGAGVARGYWHRPELTTERFVTNPFSQDPEARLYKTGDLARYLPDGTIEFLGRTDHQVKIHGFRIELGEIEAVLRQQSAVREAVVLAREDEPGHKHLVAYVVLHQEQVFSTSELRQFLQSQLPEYMVPVVFVPLKSLPLTPNGKVDRQALPAPELVRSEMGRTFVAPQTAIEQALAEIWVQVLRVEQVGVHDNFFELGGDSILSIQVIARANKLGLRFTPKQLFQHQTIAQLARVINTTQFTQWEQRLITGSLPLTPIQHRFFEQDIPERHHWNQAVLLEVQPVLNFERLEQTIQHLLEQHDALRLRFEQTGSNWQQVNAALAPVVPCSRVDLSMLTATEQSEAIEAATTQLQNSLNLSHGPLLRVALFDLGKYNPGRLLLVIHHLAVDGLSWRILLEDLETVYQQLSQGKAIQLPPKTTSFKRWSESLHEYAHSGACDPELSYWFSMHCPSQLPIDSNEGANTVASAQIVSVSLTAEETQVLLQEVPAVYHTRINEVLLTALVQSFSQWTGTCSLLVDLESHGREAIIADVDLSRTVGWFTSIFPVHLVGNSTEPGKVLKAIKEQLRKVPHGGIGYGILRYLSPDKRVSEQLRSLPQPEVVFNYLGQFDQSLADSSLFKLAAQASSGHRSPQALRSHLLEINGAVIGGNLRLDWTYSKALHQQITIERLAQGFLKALRSLLVHCQSPDAGGYTPADFPKAKLNQADLDTLIARITQAGGGTQ